MTIQEKDFKRFAQVRPELVQLADRLVDLLPLRDDEHFGFTRVGLIYRNQAFRECLLTGRSTRGSKNTYATYQMPNGKAYKVAVDITQEQLDDNVTLRVCPIDLDEHIGIPCGQFNPYFLQLKIDEFIYGLQELTPEEAICEVMSANLSDDEIITCFKAIAFNDTFKFKSSGGL